MYTPGVQNVCDFPQGFRASLLGGMDDRQHIRGMTVGICLDDLPCGLRASGSFGPPRTTPCAFFIASAALVRPAIGYLGSDTAGR
jgi:hypothetical protein